MVVRKILGATATASLAVASYHIYSTKTLYFNRDGGWGGLAKNLQEGSHQCPHFPPTIALNASNDHAKHLIEGSESRK